MAMFELNAFLNKHLRTNDGFSGLVSKCIVVDDHDFESVDALISEVKKHFRKLDSEQVVGFEAVNVRMSDCDYHRLTGEFSIDYDLKLNKPVLYFRRLDPDDASRYKFEEVSMKDIKPRILEVVKEYQTYVDSETEKCQKEAG